MNRRGEEFHVDVGGELILSAGAIQSPQLLMLSGIGDAELLSKSGIAVQQHMPGVGENLQDHPAWCFEYGATNPGDSLASKLRPFRPAQNWHRVVIRQTRIRDFQSL